jgi:K+-transporting ATPase c subunit
VEARSPHDCRARNLLVHRGRQFGFFGEPRVDVLLLDIALGSAFRTASSTTR